MSDNNNRLNSLRSLNDISVIIPTSNRNYYLSRCLAYHSQYQFGKIIIADSSSSKEKQEARKIVSLPNLNTDIEYLEYPPETEPCGEDFYQKWADALEHVETKYSIFCTDKEFLVPSTLCKCIECLEMHKDCNVAEGNYYYIESPSPGKYRSIVDVQCTPPNAHFYKLMQSPD